MTQQELAEILRVDISTIRNRLYSDKSINRIFIKMCLSCTPEELKKIMERFYLVGAIKERTIEEQLSELNTKLDSL